jgi:hypothetical protein
MNKWRLRAPLVFVVEADLESVRRDLALPGRF